MLEKQKTRQKRPRGNLTKISDIIPSVKEKLGIEKNIEIMLLREIWAYTIGSEIARHSQVAYFDKEKNIVIAVNSGTLTVDLSMQKASILARLKEATKNTNITFKDIRFVLR